MLASFKAWHYIEFAPFIASIPGYFLGEPPRLYFGLLSISYTLKRYKSV